MTEFEIIDHYFKNNFSYDTSVDIGIGDDAAILKIPPNKRLAISTDTLVADVHFFSKQNPIDIGYKSLAVNLSDMAAMGATPRWFTLSLTLPNTDEKWIDGFVKGIKILTDEHQLNLIGGDLSQGPLSITITILGELPFQQQLLRAGARPGDIICVTGCLGDAALALHSIQTQKNIAPEDFSLIQQRLFRPTPRIKEGEKLLGKANAAIDISDGLLADLNHILEASQVGATVWADKIPLSSVMKNLVDEAQALQFALTGGDDYELCFTISPDQQNILSQLNATMIGVIEAKKDLRVLNSQGQLIQLTKKGYEHFNENKAK